MHPSAPPGGRSNDTRAIFAAQQAILTGDLRTVRRVESAPRYGTIAVLLPAPRARERRPRTRRTARRARCGATRRSSRAAADDGPGEPPPPAARTAR